MRAVHDGLADLRRHDSMESSLPRMQTRAELYELLGYVPGQQWDYPSG
jgi:2-methylisocitrate lyase-like PEP mutase family enzyme